MKKIQDRRWEIAAAVLLLAYVAAAVGPLVEMRFRPGWDGGLYAVLGRALARGEGYTYLGHPFVLRPPGMSWMIAVITPQGLLDFESVNRLVMAFAAASAVAMYFAFSALRTPKVALAVALLVATCPEFVRLFNFIMSDFPFIALVYGGLALLLRSGERRRGIPWALAAGAMFAAAVYMRVVALVLLPGLFAFGWTRAARGRRELGLAVGSMTMALSMPWLLWSRAATGLALPVSQLLQHDYITSTFRVGGRNPSAAWIPLSEIFRRIASNGAQILRDWGDQLVGFEDLTVGVILVIPLALGCARAVRTKGIGIPEWWAISYLGVLLVYFANTTRLALPIFPLAVFYLVLGLQSIGERLRGPLGRGFAPSIVVLLLGANLLRAPETLSRWPPRWEGIHRLADWIRAETPEDAVILCGPAPSISALTDRTAFSFRFDPDPDLLGKYRPDYLVVRAKEESIRRLADQAASAAVRQWTLSSDASQTWKIFEFDRPERVSGPQQP